MESWKDESIKFEESLTDRLSFKNLFQKKYDGKPIYKATDKNIKKLIDQVFKDTTGRFKSFDDTDKRFEPTLVIDLNCIDVSRVTNMDDLFAHKMREVRVDVSNWDTSNVKSMHGMFQSSLITCDMSNWDVSSLENIGYMFFSYFGSDPIKMGINNWKITDKLVRISSCFFGCPLLSKHPDWWDKAKENHNKVYKDDSIYDPDWTAPEVLKWAKKYNPHMYDILTSKPKVNTSPKRDDSIFGIF